MKRLMTIFDTAPLITCCKFEVDGQPIVDHILPHCHIIIPSAVRQELVAEQGRYPDAVIAADRVSRGTIEVREVCLPNENVLDYYGLGEGEQEAIAMGLELDEEIDALVMDDKLGYIVCGRLELKQTFLLDLILRLAQDTRIDREQARRMIEATRSRYTAGMVKHSLSILDRGERKCL
jgi:predicted nucleic acid-binding protein